MLLRCGSTQHALRAIFVIFDFEGEKKKGGYMHKK